MQELKRNRQALTAAVYEEARVREFDGSVLKLAFPEEQSFYVGMANDRKHADELGKVLETRIGTRPRVEAAVYGGDEPPFASGGEAVQPAPAPAPEETPRGEPEPRKAPEESPEPGAGGGAWSPDETPRPGTGDATAGGAAGGGATGEAEPDDIIRDPREVVEMARQRFGSSVRETGGGS